MSPASVAEAPLTKKASTARSLGLLAVATVLCLLPFSGRAFNIDDPLFLWSAQHILHHPFDPFGFQVNWYQQSLPMSQVTENPPLACYYAALIGSIAGFSERALHLGFLLPALAVVLGTYRLAQCLTRSPLVAAAATLFAPGLLISAGSVMCDTLMLAFWMWAVVLWVEGLDGRRQGYLLAAALLTSAAALSKFFGISLVPLLFAYSFARFRRVGRWAGYLAVPIAVLVGYHFWTHALYGVGMFGTAMAYAPQRILQGRLHALFYPVVCASFIGGCALPALLMAPLLWSRRSIVITSLVVGVAAASGLYLLRYHLPMASTGTLLQQHSTSVGLQLAIYVAGGISVLALAVADLRQHRDADSLLLAPWVFGTFAFAAFLNWTINARSILPLIPPVGILLARRLDAVRPRAGVAHAGKTAVALLVSAGLALWIARADLELAASGKRAAEVLRERTRNTAGTVWFEGHWGFQYYMQQMGLHAFDFTHTSLHPGDVVIVPRDDFTTVGPPRQFVSLVETLQLPLREPVTTLSSEMGAAFYHSGYGPLPFAWGKVPPQQYAIYHIAVPLRPEQWPPLRPK
ncbi:MAG TPA: glycosyltransferase family 39 protein [Candidatus Binatia bacterium]|nr:glycosyltransferase family 39 protein [Candidatus Binatia bacterium]